MQKNNEFSIDILNRLDTMQSQVIQFFDIKSASAINRLNHIVNATRANVNETNGSIDDFIPISIVFNDAKIENLIGQNNNATNATVDQLIETGTISTTALTANDEQNASNFTVRATRKRKRTTNTVHTVVLLILRNFTFFHVKFNDLLFSILETFSP